MNTTSFRAIFVAATAGAFVASAHAQIAYDTMDAYRTFGIGTAGFGTSTDDIGWVANSFTSALNGTMTTIDIAINNYSGTTSKSFNISLYTFDTGTSGMGTLLDTWTGMSDPNSFNGTTVTNSHPYVSIDTEASNIHLTAGTSYYLKVWSDWFSSSNSGTIVWNAGTSGAPNTYRINHSSGSTYGPSSAVPGALRITTVPEPASMAGLAVGALALLRRRRS